MPYNAIVMPGASFLSRVHNARAINNNQCVEKVEVTVVRSLNEVVSVQLLPILKQTLLRSPEGLSIQKLDEMNRFKTNAHFVCKFFV